MITVEINEDYLHEIINEWGMVGLRVGFCREYFEGNKPIGEEAAMLKIVDDMSDNWKSVLSFLESLNGDRYDTHCPWCGRKLNESNEAFEKCCVTELELMKE